jgi:hypothetical protein
LLRSNQNNSRMSDSLSEVSNEGLYSDPKAEKETKVVIPENECNRSTLVDHLRDILSNLHYDTYICHYCGWVDRTGKNRNRGNWTTCHDCTSRICWFCYDEHGQESDIVYCHECKL